MCTNEPYWPVPSKPLAKEEALVTYVSLIRSSSLSSAITGALRLQDSISSRLAFTPNCWTMKKGLHPQMQWISYVTQSGRLMHVMMTRIHHVGKVYHFGAKRQMAQSIGQIAKFKRRFNEQEAEAGQQNNNENQK